MVEATTEQKSKTKKVTFLGPEVGMDSKGYFFQKDKPAEVPEEIYNYLKETFPKRFKF